MRGGNYTYLNERDLRDRVVGGDGVEYPEEGGGMQRDKGDGEALAKGELEALVSSRGLFLSCRGGVDGKGRGEGRGNMGERDAGEARAGA